MDIIFIRNKPLFFFKILSRDSPIKNEFHFYPVKNMNLILMAILLLTGKRTVAPRFSQTVFFNHTFNVWITKSDFGCLPEWYFKIYSRIKI
jgi:hypothetical protein